MSTAVPPSPTPPPPAAGGAPPQAAASVPQAPPALLALRPGDGVAVTLLATAAGGKVPVDSDLGRFLLRTPLPLPDGTAVRLVLVGISGDTAFLRVQSIDGKPLAQGLHDLQHTGLQQAGRGGAAAAGTGTGTGVVAGAAVHITATPPGLGAAMRAIVLGVPGGGAAGPVEGAMPRPPEGGAPLPAGTVLTVRLGGFAPPGAPPGAALTPLPSPTAATPPLAVPPAAMPAGIPPPTGPAPATGLPFTAPPPASLPSGTAPPPAPPPVPPPAPPPPAPPPPTGGQLPAHIPGQSPAVPASTAAAPPLLVGTVTPNSAAGQPLVATPAGLLALDTSLDLPPGARVGLEILGRLPPAPPPAAAPPSLLAASPAAGGWASLGEALDQLGRADPQAARALAAALPAADTRLLANTMAFMQAARAVDARVWPGEPALRALEASSDKGKISARRLAAEVEGAAGRARDTSGEWRTLAMPFVHGGEIDRIAIISRRPGGGGEEEEDARRRGGHGQGRRFLLTFDLSALGAMQMDGLYQSRTRRLDLVLRTHRPLPETVRRDILGIHARAAQALGLSGGISFAVTDRFIVPRADGEGGDGDGGGGGVTA